MAAGTSGDPLEQQLSGGTELYESAEDLDSLPSHSRASSFSTRRRSSDAGASRASSAASMRASTTDTASSPERRPRSTQMGAAPAGSSRSSSSVGNHQSTSSAAVTAAAEQMQEISLEEGAHSSGPSAAPGRQEQQQEGEAAEQPTQQPARKQGAAVVEAAPAGEPNGVAGVVQLDQPDFQQQQQQQQQRQLSGPSAEAESAGAAEAAAVAEPAAGSAAAPSLQPGPSKGGAAHSISPAAPLAAPPVSPPAAAAAPAPSPAAATSAAAAAPGAALFSVPMASAPTTGIYSIPQEMFRIRDLDAGKEYSLDQRYWIKDMDTGNVYVLESEEGPGGSRSSSAAGATGEGRVTELLSGRELSVGEFEDALGFFRVPQPAPQPLHMLGAGPTSSSDSGAGGGGGAGAAVQQAAQKSLKSFTSGATWVKASVGGMISSLKQGSPRGDRGSGPGSPSGHSLAQRVSSGSGSPPNLDDRQGQPVKVQVYRKSYKEFTDMRLVQQLGGHQGVVWTMKFSRNGKFLASAGQDCVIRVWEVAPSRGTASAPGTPVESDVPLDDGPAAGGAAGAGSSSSAGGGLDGSGLLADPSVAVFQQRPYRVYRGHKQDVLDLCWSKTQFLLSASMDKTVRLWHVSMDECLRVFKHTDFVTAIDFHPLDDKMFLSGSIDGKVRLWNIPEQRVVSWQDVHEMVTAVTYSLDGRKAVVGTMKGKCRFYTIEKSTLEYEAQLDVKNKRGQHSRGKKITGLAFLPAEPGKLLITSNDSRVRLYDGYTLRCKYKGHTNRNTQIRASFSPGGDYITCGSDDGWVYVWGTRKSGVPPSGAGSAFEREPDNPLAKEKNASYECFQANGDIVTVAVFAPGSCHRSAESMSPTAEALRHQRSNSLGDKAEGEVALAAARARGQVLVTAGYTGEIKVYENIGLPQWL